jgi:hypothetical protein
MSWKNVTISSVCSTASGSETSLPLMEMIFCMSHFFSSDVWFHLPGYINSQNSHVWLGFNSHEITETPLHDKKVGVWCGISHVLWGHCQLWTLFELILYPFIGHLNEDSIAHGYFQQDGAAAHMALLHNVFGEQLISRGICPLNSSDLSAPDFYL